MEKVTWSPEDAGCLIGGHAGWTGHYQMVDIAIDSGWPISDQDRELVDRYRVDELDHEASEAMFTQGGIMDDAETWLNENVAPDGYSFGWYDGEYFLASQEWWEDN